MKERYLNVFRAFQSCGRNGNDSVLYVCVLSIIFVVVAAAAAAAALFFLLALFAPQNEIYINHFA